MIWWQIIRETDKYKTFNNGTLRISATDPAADSGEYTCQVKGSASSMARKALYVEVIRKRRTATQFVNWNLIELYWIKQVHRWLNLSVSRIKCKMVAGHKSLVPSRREIFPFKSVGWEMVIQFPATWMSRCKRASFTVCSFSRDLEVNTVASTLARLAIWPPPPVTAPPFSSKVRFIIQFLFLNELIQSIVCIFKKN